MTQPSTPESITSRIMRLRRLNNDEVPSRRGRSPKRQQIVADLLDLLPVLKRCVPLKINATATIAAEAADRLNFPYGWIEPILHDHFNSVEY